MKSLVLIFALILTATAVSNRKISATQKSRYEVLKNSGTWAGFYLKLAEVQVMIENPLEDLIDAIEEAAEDLDDKKDAADAAFQKRTNQHEAEVNRLLGSIANTKLAIEQLEDKLEALATEKKELEAENARLNRENAGLVEHITEATQVRIKQRAAFATQKAEHGAGIEAVDQCIKILENLQNGPSLLQIKNSRKSFTQIHQKLQKSSMVDAHILLALVEMAANQEFASESAVVDLIAKFREIANNLTASLFRLVDGDVKAEAGFQADLDDSNGQIATNNGLISDNNKALKINADTTVATNNLLITTKDDLANLEDELQAERESYEKDKAIYIDLLAQFAAEKAACAEAIEILETADIPDYLAARLNAEGGLVTGSMDTAQQHGSGLDVFKEFDV